MEFDEQKAIEFINLRLTEAGRKPYDEDEVFNIIDMGLLSGERAA